MEHGAFGYLTKPVQRETLLGNVRRAIASVNCKKQRFHHLHKLESKITARTHELEKAMHLLENQGRHLDTIINGMEEGFLAVDYQNAIVLMNKQAQNILNVLFSDCAGQKIETAVKDPVKADALISTIRGSNTINEPYKIMVLFGTRHFAVCAQKTIDEMGSVTGYVITLLDQSEKIRNNLLQDSFLSIVAHELRTPINVIMNYLALLRFQGSDEVMRNMAIADMHESSARMKYLVNNVISFVNLSNATMSVERVSVDIRKLIETEVQKLKTKAADKNVSFNIITEQQKMTMLTDLNLFCIAIGNVLSNAVKYNKINGRVTVGIKQAAAESQKIVIDIADEGEGISGRAKTNLFECFIQGEDPLTRSHQGLGTGLFLAKRATELLGGTINVSSTRGKGACFSLSFPIETQQLS
jgi:two-component system phosphate regulon sensor histidine kinase PhoR